MKGKPLIDLTDRTFGHLRVIERVSARGEGHPMWRCQCECGNECIVYGHNLRSNMTRSCGCLRKDELRRRKTHD